MVKSSWWFLKLAVEVCELKQMELHLKITLACISNILLFHCCSCDELGNGPGMVNWTCTCASDPLGAHNFSLVTNCSSACNCTPEEAEGGPDGKGWTCLCAPERPPQILGIHDFSCFTACNCTSGSPNTSGSAEKHISIKIFVFILLLCVVLTTIAFIASVTCYLYQKDRFLSQPCMSSSDRDTSWNSETNLISHQSASLPEFRVKINSQSNLITGIIQRASFMFKSRKGTLPGIIVQFSFIELEIATNKFSNANLIGLGGSSKVYRGQLKDGRVVAIKKLMMHGDSHEDSGFLTEIEVISRLNHCHVVPLLGYCSETQGKHIERLLIFEYMPNGNLRDCLDVKQGKEPVDWGTRISIALGSARGLEYLHEAAAPRILHRDVKSTNILLDDRYRAKITDLGMAKRLMTDDLTSCTNSPARMLGTFGYFAPEYANVGKASLKSDVFSFGVVILELLTGRQPISRSTNKSDESLVIWATPLLCDSKLVLSELPDPCLKGNFPAEEMQIMTHLARECLQWDPDSRPTMSEVVHILSTISSDKSKRRNFPVSVFSNPLSHSFKNITEIENLEGFPEGSTEIVDIRRLTSERWHARRSLPLAVDRTLCEDQKNNGSPILSAAGYIQRLIVLSPNAQSWQPPDDESVDLTEPRFESFFQANIQSL